MSGCLKQRISGTTLRKNCSTITIVEIAKMAIWISRAEVTVLSHESIKEESECSKRFAAQRDCLPADVS
jgi:hypothetical protein